MSKDGNEFEDEEQEQDHEHEQEQDHEDPWETHRGHTIDLGKSQPLNESPPTRFTRLIEPSPEFIAQLKERGRKYQERKRLQEAQALEEKQSEPERPEWDEESYPGPGEAFKLALQDQLAKIERETGEEGRAGLKQKREAVREADREIDRLKRQLRREYSEDFPERELPWPPDWITNIKNELKDKRTKDRFDVFWNVWDYRWGHRIKGRDSQDGRDKCIRFGEHIGAEWFSKGKKWEKTPYVFCNPVDLKKMEKYLGCSRSTVERYTRMQVSIGLLKTFEGEGKRFKKAGRHAETVYAIGWWHPWGGGFKPIPFLSKKEFEKKIRSLFGLEERGLQTS